MRWWFQAMAAGQMPAAAGWLAAANQEPTHHHHSCIRSLVPSECRTQPHTQALNLCEIICHYKPRTPTPKAAHNATTEALMQPV